MSGPITPDPDLEWLDHVQPVGLVVAPSLLKELALVPATQTRVDNAEVAAIINSDGDGPALPDPWAFARHILGWPPSLVEGAPGGPSLDPSLSVYLPEQRVSLLPHWAVRKPARESGHQLLVRIEAFGVDPDGRGELEGWEATPQQRFERLLRESGIEAGILICDRGQNLNDAQLRLVYAPKGETSGWIAFPLRPLASVAGRSMLGGLKLILDSFRLFKAPPNQRLTALLKASRDAQALVSTKLSGQVLGALHELLRGLKAAEPDLIGELAEDSPTHVYEGLLTVLMRLVFVLYAEDRDLLPSRIDKRARDFYDQGYSVRNLHAKLLEDHARNPDTMDERLGAWGRLLALFRLVHAGHPTSDWIRGRQGRLFDPDIYPFLEGRREAGDRPSVPKVTDGAVLRMLDGLLMLDGERLSYRTLDVEQIGSVYETVMGFTVELAAGPVLAIKGGKNKRTPVYVDLAASLAAKPGERIKLLKESSHRGDFPAAVEKGLKAAKSQGDLEAALEAVVDERASPNKQVLPAGAVILQPTDERRRTGSHYTPRSLTEPIVRHALEPAFQRLGPDAKPEDVLELKVCDPAMGSAAFLVEACRALATRLVRAWGRWPETRPAIPHDEDEDLHARRLVAQRCLYGVDRNPMAVDLARLSLWLATLARDHEFTFLDHALKCGDSLVGLTREQITALHWNAGRGLPLFGALVRERFQAAIDGRREIREAPDDVTRAEQEQRYRRVESRLDHVRLIGNAIVAAFFSAEKPKARERQRQAIESWGNGPAAEMWPKLEDLAGTLTAGPHPIRPFHWEIEFPEVFARDNPGFDAIIGNPPFAGKNTIAAGNHDVYLNWLKTLNTGAHGNADLVAHFFRRAFSLIRENGAFGLIATNTIGQGDTRETGLTAILRAGGRISHAIRRLKWPGEAAVVVSVVNVVNGGVVQALLEGRPVARISAYLVDSDLDGAPARLAGNRRKAFVGSYVLGMGFTFDDTAAAKGAATSLAEMERLIDKHRHNAERIKAYIGGEEVNTDPRQQHHRYIIDFEDFPLCRDESLESWGLMAPENKVKNLRTGTVPQDYPGPVAEDWPDLLGIVNQLVLPERKKKADKQALNIWWRFLRPRPELKVAIAELECVLAVPRVSPHLCVSRLPKNVVYSDKLIVIADSGSDRFATLQSRPHELWTRLFASSMKDDLRYTPSDCFESFPFHMNFGGNAELKEVGSEYYSFRAKSMICQNKGLTKTYNCFHDGRKTDPDIVRLRELHTAMDHAVLRAYGWDDLIPEAIPVFLDESNEDEFKYQGRYFWPAEFRDKVLARLLALNAERAAEERALGLDNSPDDDDETDDDIEGDEE